MEMNELTTEPSSHSHWIARLKWSWSIRSTKRTCCGCVLTWGAAWSNTNLSGEYKALIQTHLSSPGLSNHCGKQRFPGQWVTKARKIRENRSYPISRLTKEQAVSRLPLNIQGPSPRIWKMDVKEGLEALSFLKSCPVKVAMDIRLWNPRPKATRAPNSSFTGLYVLDVMEIEAWGAIRKELKWSPVLWRVKILTYIYVFRGGKEKCRIQMGGMKLMRRESKCH